MKNILTKLIVVVVVMIIGVSCAKKETFNLAGIVNDTPEGELLIYKIKDNKLDTLAYTKFTQGKFEIDSLRAPIDQPTFVSVILRPKKSDEPNVQITYKKFTLILDNTNMNAEFTMGSNNQILKGSLYNEKVLNFDTSNEELVLLKSNYEEDLKKYQTLRGEDGSKEEVTKASETVRASYKSFSEKKGALIGEEVKNSNDAVYNAFLLVVNANLVKPEDFVAQADVILPMVEKENKSITKDLLIQKKKYENQLNASVGKPFTDFSLTNMEGNAVKLSEVVKENEYVLLDFWASWCGPCRAEVPNLKNAYSEYNAKGFGIFMVSIDRDKAKWEEASTEENLPWANVLDRNGVQGTYAVTFIPQNFLIDKEGMIVAKNLRGENLEKKLLELLDKS